jgi:hypothetical protein
LGGCSGRLSLDLLPEKLLAEGDVRCRSGEARVRLARVRSVLLNAGSVLQRRFGPWVEDGMADETKIRSLVKKAVR